MLVVSGLYFLFFFLTHTFFPQVQNTARFASNHILSLLSSLRPAAAAELQAELGLQATGDQQHELVHSATPIEHLKSAAGRH